MGRLTRENVHGITIDGNGRYLMARVDHHRSGWRIGSAQSWDATNGVRNALLLGRGVVLGMPSHWGGQLPVGLGDDLIAPGEKGRYAPYTPSAVHHLHARYLVDNLLGTVADDAFLCTIPLVFGKPDVDSFVAVCREEGYYRIGIVLKRRLFAVFSLAPGTPEALGGHLGRIKRYLAAHAPEHPSPACVYGLNDVGILPAGSDLTSVSLSISGLGPDGPQTRGVMRAAGAALARRMPESVPWFTKQSPESGLRRVRAAMYLASAGLVAATVLGAAATPLAKAWIERRTGEAQAQYDSAISENRTVGAMVEENRKLARKILRLGGTFSMRTRWAQLMEEIGNGRPSGLFLDRVGSDGVNDQGTSRLVFTGWASSEELVTDFMARMKRSGIVSDLQLSSLVRDGKNDQVCRFKITCRFAARELPGSDSVR